MKHLTQKMDRVLFFPKSGHFTRFSKNCKGRPPPYPLFARVNFEIVLQLILIFLVPDKRNGFIFELQILAIETAIERLSNNASILQKAVLCSRALMCATVVHFRFYHIIFLSFPY